MSIQKITDVDNIEVTPEQWWFLYNEETKIIIEGPEQCCGSITSPDSLIIGDTEEELDQYIIDNDLIIPPGEEYDPI